MSDQKTSYSELFNELRDIVNALEDGEIEIDMLTSKVRRGAELVTQCNEILTATEDEINKVMTSLKEQDINIEEKRDAVTKHLESEAGGEEDSDLPF